VLSALQPAEVAMYESFLIVCALVVFCLIVGSLFS